MRTPIKLWIALLCVFFLITTQVSKAQVIVQQTKNEISFGNQYLVRSFLLAGNKLTPGTLVNKKNAKGEVTYTPTKGSEEFIIHPVSDDLKETTPQKVICASALNCQKVQKENIEDGQRLIFSFAPYLFQNISWTVQLVYEMRNADSYMHKYLKIAVPDSQRATARIDYIDTESLGTENVSSTNMWSHPQEANIGSGQNGFMAGLGQPIYIEGMFFGSEFPDTDNRIDGGKAFVRYYSGKSFAQLSKENRISADGFFTSWPNVIGATRSNNDIDVVQADFFSYIYKEVARPQHFQLQYNSWYDWKQEITSERIISSFKEMERGFSQHGLRPIDSYAIDNGWNAYAHVNNTYSTPNKSDFWEFNGKFPNGLTESSDFAHLVNSKFGLWLSPRGGYTYQAEWAKYLEEKGTGLYNEVSKDIVTNDNVYLKRLEEFMLKCQKDYDINYWKFDGFMTKVPQPSKEDRYMSGGYEGMYYTTEHWERWNTIIEHLYQDAASRGTKLWVNLTSYVTPSPWMLRMGNSLWLQISSDQEDLNLGRDNKLEKQLNYRDNIYYELIHKRQFQIPLSSYFHHDPCFGKECCEINSANDDQFRMYLYMISMRGAALWDMLYSYNYLDIGNKWMINTEALQFAESNYTTLRHSRFFGARPSTKQPYGYSAWNEQTKEGFVAVRNPGPMAQQMTVTLNDKIGVPVDASKLYRSLVMEYLPSQPAEDAKATYRYGDNITLALAPGEIRIWRFATALDTRTPEFVRVTSDSVSNVVKAKFDIPIRIANARFEVKDEKGQTVGMSKAELGADFKTVTLMLNKALKTNRTYTVVAQDVTNWSDQSAASIISPPFYCNSAGLIAEAGNSARMQLLKKSFVLKTKKSVSGKGDFNILLNVKTDAKEAQLLSQGNDIRLALTDGKVTFTVCGLTVTSAKSIADGTTHTIGCCREANGMLKIYLDGILDKSAYDSSILSPAIHSAPISVGDANISLGNLRIENFARDYKEQSFNLL